MNAARFLPLIVCVAGLLCCGCDGPRPVEFLRQYDWADRGEWLKVDTHIHTKFSDGGHLPLEIASKAVEHGCDAIAITDHADSNLTAASSEYFEAIEVARRQFPDLMILAGLEWNVPPDGGDTHAVLLVPPGPDEEPLLREFKLRFDDLTANEADTKKLLIHTTQRLQNGLRFLADRSTSTKANPLLLFEHVGRKSESSSTSLDLLRLARKTNRVVTGFSGAPGHQADKVRGSYRGAVTPIDRWDPAVAEVGGAWDQILQSGDDIWGAGAPSDFHNLQLDYWPGQFSETWVRVPERSPAGVLAGLRAGTYFGVHGRFVRDVDLRVEMPGLPRAAHAGESVSASQNHPVNVVLTFSASTRDWQDRPSTVETVELIAISRSEVRIVDSAPPGSDGIVRFGPQTVPSGGVVFRARGRSTSREGGACVFYTNPIRIQTRDEQLWNPTRLIAVVDGLRENWRAVSAVALLTLAGLGMLGGPLTSRCRHRVVCVPRRSTLRTRRIFFVGEVGLAVVAIYASLVPFHFQQTTPTEAWERLKNSASPDMQLSRGDVAVNVLIAIPLAYCGLAAAGIPRTMGALKSAVAAILATIACGAFAIGLELSQCWFPPRVPAASDCAAQAFGAVLGATGWWLTSRRVSLFVESLFRSRTLASRRDWALQLYVALFVAWHWLPLDVVLSPQDLLHKLRQGSLELIPFTFSFKSRSDELSSYVSAVLLALPVGAWGALAWNRNAGRPREWSWAFLMAAAVVTAAEGGQILVHSRVASITTWLVGLVGASVAAAVALVIDRRLTHRAADELRLPWYRTATCWVLASLAYSAVLAGVFWAPFEIVRDDVLLSARFRGLFSPPLTVLHRGADAAAMFHLIRNALWFLPWGGMLGLIAVSARGREHRDRVWWIVVVSWTIAWSVLLELGQCVLVGHAGDSADILARAGGAFVGLTLIRLWASNTTVRV